MSIKSAITEVRDRIARAAVASGRDPASVRLIAASKTKPASAIREAYAAGQRDFGENYAQELVQKAEELADLIDLRWHFIGHLQSNKARFVTPVVHFVHTVDSTALARELDKRMSKSGGTRLRVLVEVNVGGEAQKHGCSAFDLPAILSSIEECPSLQLCGLMTMPPNDLEAARRAFEALASLRTAHGGPERMPELSMGMSSDLEVAIACGSTMVRVGTALFGSR